MILKKIHNTLFSLCIIFVVLNMVTWVRVKTLKKIVIIYNGCHGNKQVKK